MASSSDAHLQGTGPVDPEPATTPRKRLDSIDLLRGIVMVIMMLDHTRDFVHSGAFQFDPTDLKQTTIAVFLTRWITHYCAPIFVFLAGTGAYLQFMRGKSKAHLSKFLLTRGLWLILLEVTLVRFGVFFNLDYRFLGFFQVIWVIGISMVILAGLIHLPLKLIGFFGVAMIFLHNLLDGFHVAGWQGPNSPIPGFGAKLWILLHDPFKLFPLLPFSSPVIFVVYNIIPWVGVMAAGYAFGAVYRFEVARRRRWLLTIGTTATALFLVLRAINIYGDPARWSGQKNFVFTVLSFINTTKYPPSLLFLLMTLGPAMLALVLFESGINLLGALRKILVTFGRVPLFFYLLQWYTAHGIGIIIGLIAGQPVAWQWESPISKFSHPPIPGIGFRLWVVYLCWIAGVLMLYPLCKWFAGVKARRKDWWLSYL
ncbi:MAG TPA: heparan-alpha-glucosaminide N-acetyltransferase domain-containing protein [Pyrinomonadaceae bacterium]|nr:heparan-alpha-glucosaminide N-acetyltransferase domain-containing protein [Pyrinomonadaceae bacterium]